MPGGVGRGRDDAGKCRHLSQPATASGTSVALSAPIGSVNVPQNELQTVTIGAAVTNGNFKLSFTTPAPDNTTAAANTTANIPFNASPEAVEEKLEALGNIGTGNVAVSSPNPGGGAAPGGPYTIEFTGGRFADTNVNQLARVNGEPNLNVAGNAGATVATLQQGTGVLEVCTSNCQAGIQGSAGVGQFNIATSVALDSTGNVYIFDSIARRVQKFSATGEFLLMFGGEVNKTTTANVCTKADLDADDVCGAGTTGGGAGQFGAVAALSTLLAITNDDRVYVGDVGRIQRFNTSGEYQDEIAVPGETINALAADSAGNLYAAYWSSVQDNKPNVRKIHSLFQIEVCSLTAGNPRAIDVAPNGEVYVFDKSSQQILRFGASCEENVPPAPLESFGEGLSNASTGLAANDVTCGAGGIAIYHSNNSPSFLRAYSPAPDPACVGDPPARAPEIVGQFAQGVTTEEATLRARINPYFWEDTRYYVQYGTAACLEAGDWEAACVSEQPTPPGALLGGGFTDTPVTTAGVLLEGLQAGTAYRYRFIAHSSGDPEPVFGAEAGFVTHAPPTAGSCPNQAFRLGVAAALPDCRAYEMVSPVDKGGGDIIARGSVEGNLEGARRQSAPDGGRLTYTSQTAFGGAQRGALSSQYLSSRSEGAGWTTQPLNPPQGRLLSEGDDYGYGINFRAFSEDLCETLVRDNNVEPLTADALVGHTNLYQRDNCGAGAGGYQALTKDLAFPAGTDLQHNVGTFSRQGGHVVFAAGAPLQSNPAPANTGNQQIYDYDPSTGDLRLVSVLPGGGAFAGGADIGSAPSGLDARFATLARAVSNDGSRIFWSTGAGALYVRVDGTTTIPVSGAVTTEPSRLWSAAGDGSKALFTFDAEPGAGENNLLYEFDVDKALAGEPATTLIAFVTGGVVGASEDLSRLYFTSLAPLAPGATPGEWNVYLRQPGESGPETVFIATVSPADRGEGIAAGTNLPPTIDGAGPVTHASRVTPDGRQLVFMSNRQLTGYDNADAVTGEPASQVYRYDAGSDQLHCVSCNPTGARAEGRRMPAAYQTSGTVDLQAAAWIPNWEWADYGKRSLSVDGDRVFFNAFDALALRDTNGAQDVYQWEAPGSGTCTTQSGDYSQQNGGCVSLISTGKSRKDSEFLDASANGRDVFFTTASSLDPRDPGSVDVYDARELGGFPPPPPPPPACVGDACQSPAATPQFQTPSSSSSAGPGNPVLGRDCRASARRAQRLSNRAKSQHRAARRAKAQGKAERLRRSAKRSSKRARGLSKRAKRCRAANRRQANMSRRAGR